MSTLASMVLTRHDTRACLALSSTTPLPAISSNKTPCAHDLQMRRTDGRIEELYESGPIVLWMIYTKNKDFTFNKICSEGIQFAASIWRRITSALCCLFCVFWCAHCAVYSCNEAEVLRLHSLNEQHHCMTSQITAFTIGVSRMFLGSGPVYVV